MSNDKRLYKRNLHLQLKNQIANRDRMDEMINKTKVRIEKLKWS